MVADIVISANFPTPAAKYSLARPRTASKRRRLWFRTCKASPSMQSRLWAGNARPPLSLADSKIPIRAGAARASTSGACRRTREFVPQIAMIRIQGRYSPHASKAQIQPSTPDPPAAPCKPRRAPCSVRRRWNGRCPLFTASLSSCWKTWPKTPSSSKPAPGSRTRPPLPSAVKPVRSKCCPNRSIA